MDPISLTLFALCSWGHSAGGTSVTAHLATNPTNPPFKAAIFVRYHDLKSVSASLILHSVALALQLCISHLQDGQPEAPDHLRPLGKLTGCASAADTLGCLRAAPYATLKDAINTTPSFLSPNGLDLTWGISIDGDLIQKSLNQYIREGCYARVPVLGGQVDDEGT